MKRLFISGTKLYTKERAAQISDGDSYQPYMVVTQLNDKTANSEIEQYAVVSLDKCV